jgi:hypothetical protein
MSRAQREKGKRGERLWRDTLRYHGFEAERAGYKQARLGSGGADVEDDSGFWWEVKFVERLNVREAYKQACSACPLGSPPAVAHKTSNELFLVTLAAEDFLQVLGELRKHKQLVSELQREISDDGS